MTINRAAIRKQLEPGLNAVFGLEYKQYPELWKEIFAVSNEGKRAYVEDVLMTGLAAAQTKAEGAGVAYDQASESYVSRYIFETIALAFSITEEALEDDLYKTLGSKMSKALARSMQHTKNVKGANVLNNGFSASFPGGDGVALFSASHPLKGGGNASNILATPADLSETALEDMLIQIGQVVDDRGLPFPMEAKKLVVATENQFNAHRILKSELRVGTADNDANAIKGMGLIGGGAVVNRFLTDPDAWFLTTDCPDGLKHIVRVAMKNGMEGDFETGNMRYKARERYIFGWSDWRGAFGSAGS